LAGFVDKSAAKTGSKFRTPKIRFFIQASNFRAVRTDWTGPIFKPAMAQRLHPPIHCLNSRLISDRLMIHASNRIRRLATRFEFVILEFDLASVSHDTHRQKGRIEKAFDDAMEVNSGRSCGKFDEPNADGDRTAFDLIWSTRRIRLLLPQFVPASTIPLLNCC
jgi:hypothetical protein